MFKAEISTLDEEFEKSRVKGYIRTRRGKMERVKEFQRTGGGKKKLGSLDMSSKEERVAAFKKIEQVKNLAHQILMGHSYQELDAFGGSKKRSEVDRHIDRGNEEVMEEGKMNKWTGQVNR
jgi:hypothetical protein